MTFTPVCDVRACLCAGDRTKLLAKLARSEFPEVAEPNYVPGGKKKKKVSSVVSLTLYSVRCRS